jgi:hypothetical protein
LSIVSGGVLIALAVWVWVTMLVTKRMAAGAPYQLVVTRERVSSPWWEPAMGPRAGLWIGRAHSQTGSLRALFIEPLQASDVELPPSRVLRVNRMRDSTPLP